MALKVELDFEELWQQLSRYDRRDFLREHFDELDLDDLKDIVTWDFKAEPDQIFDERDLIDWAEKNGCLGCPMQKDCNEAK